MKYLITDIISTQQNGSLKEIKKTLSATLQQEIVEFFGYCAEIYTEKAVIINRVYGHLVSDVFEEYERLQREGKNVLFNAFLIMKLYQQTTRLDRGDGITMICLSRDLMDYR